MIFTRGIGGVDNGVPVLHILNDAADQPLGAVGRRVDSHELEGAGGGHGGWSWSWNWITVVELDVFVFCCSKR
jgi:hypothetical protein